MKESGPPVRPASSRGCGRASRYGWIVTLEPESDNPNQYRIVISPKSYDSFIELVGPYIHPSMIYKLPSPRSDNSRFGYMNKSLFNSLVSRFYKSCNQLSCSCALSSNSDTKDFK